MKKFYQTRRLAVALTFVVVLNLVVTLGQSNTAQAFLRQPRILFIENGNLYFLTYDVMNLNKIDRTALIAHGNAESAYWSPDGNKISYVERDGDNASLYILNSDGINPRKVGDSYSAYWSPDSSKLAFTNKNGVYVVNADASGLKQVLSGNYEFGQVGWAPSSTKLVAARNLTSDVLDVKKEAYTVNADGSNATKAFTFNGQLYGYWTDGQRIIFGNAPDDGAAIRLAGYTLTLIKPDGTERQILPNTNGSRHKLLLSPTGDKMLIGPGLTIQGATGPWTVANVANPLGTVKPIQLTGQDYIIAADWAVAPGSIYAVVQSGNQKRLEIIDITNSANRRTIINIGPETPGKPPIAQPYDYTVSTEANGLILVTEIFGTSVLVDANKGKVYPATAGQLRPDFFVDALPEFYQVWYRADAAITTYQASGRSWLWGPNAFADKVEEYAEARGGKRQVEYFDKARMELTNPEGDRSNPFFVTNGLLPKELIGGYIQLGDTATRPKAPAEINVAGDPNGSITYAKFAPVTTLSPGQNTAPNRVGQPVTATIDRNGTVSQTQAMPGVTLTTYITETGHNIPNVFDNYFVTLPQDWVFVMGYPISEPYQTEITLMGKPTKVLVQVFERRVLTYTPTNVEPYKVEQGNVGRHYYEWRYGN